MAKRELILKNHTNFLIPIIIPNIEIIKAFNNHKDFLLGNGSYSLINDKGYY